MRKTNALQMRQNLGSVLSRLEKDREPILVEKGRKPVAVLISLDDFKKRFVDVEADQKRKEYVQKIKAADISLPKGKSSLDLIRDLRK